MLYALAIGILAGLALGGRLGGLAAFPLRWWPLAILGLGVQLVLFAGPVAERIAVLGAPLYVASTTLVLLVVLRNIRLPGFPLIAVGAGANLAAVVANGGLMPTTAEALATAGLSAATALPGYSNSAIVANPVLGPLTDVLALPAWLPLANVFSVGDALVGVGLAIAIAWGMRRQASA